MTSNALDLILAFVRGEESWGVLEKAGIFIEIKNDGYEIANPWQLIAKIHLRDMAQGLLAYHLASERMQQWASIILAGSSFLDLEEFELSPEGDVLLNALWDAAFGEEVSQEAVNVARHLVNE